MGVCIDIYLWVCIYICICIYVCIYVHILFYSILFWRTVLYTDSPKGCSEGSERDMKEEGVVASGVDPSVPVPGVLGEAGASTGAREALRTRWGAPGVSPCLGQMACESKKAAVCHPAVGAVQHKAEHRARKTKMKALSFPERSVGGWDAADMMDLFTVPWQSLNFLMTWGEMQHQQKPKTYLRGATGLHACSHVNEMHWNPDNTHIVPSHFILFFRFFPSAICHAKLWDLCLTRNLPLQNLCRACSPKVCCINYEQDRCRFPQLSSPLKIQQIYPKTLEMGHVSEAFSLKGLLLISNHTAIKPSKKGFVL